jgi:aryl-alcohol dehydrogenase-like predicted oxidoreductase
MNAKRIVLGTAALGGVWGKTDPATSVRTILTALENGITAIDTAPAYGDAEEFLGKALKQWRGEMPVISTKAGRLQSYAADDARYDYTAAGIQQSVHHSLKTLGIASVDILFLHDPEALSEQQAEEAITVMQHLHTKGWVQKIGIGGNIPLWFEPYFKAGVFEVIMEFNRLNACQLIALEDRLPFCYAAGIDYYAASPLNMGLLGKHFHTWQQHPPGWLNNAPIIAAQNVQTIAEKYGLYLSTLAHRFLLSVPHEFHIVIGPADTAELERTFSDFREGPLPDAVYQDILHCNK